VAGIASIIAVMTAISVIQAAMEKEMSILGHRCSRCRSSRRALRATATDARR
jgi:hypothetical protein